MLKYRHFIKRRRYCSRHFPGIKSRKFKITQKVKKMKLLATTLALQLVLPFIAYAQTPSFCLIDGSSPFGVSVNVSSTGTHSPNWSNESKAIDNSSSTQAVASFSNPNSGLRTATITFSFSSPIPAGCNIRFKIASTLNDPSGLTLNINTSSGQNFSISGTQISGAPGDFVGDTGPSDPNGFVLSASTNSITLTFSATSGAGAIHVNDIEKSCECTILPVSLVSFTALKNNHVNQLKWSTASETNNKGFEIQRSPDAGNWHTIGFMASETTNSTNLVTYHYTDEAPLAGINYYRLKQLDIDGGFSFSPKRAIKAEERNTDITFGANPASEILNIGGDLGKIQRIRIIDNFGRVINENVPVKGNIDVSSLQKGVYILQIEMLTGKRINKRFVKE
jgi:hypothetical protein